MDIFQFLWYYRITLLCEDYLQGKLRIKEEAELFARHYSRSVFTKKNQIWREKNETSLYPSCFIALRNVRV